MNILSSNTDGIYPIREGGFKLGEMVVVGGRQSGKSLYYSYNQNLYKEIVLDGQKNMMEIMFTCKHGNEYKYKFSRAKWYVAEFDDKYYFEVEKWCTETFGPQPDVPDAWTRWYLSGLTTLKFRDSKDYEWFMLRWS